MCVSEPRAFAAILSLSLAFAISCDDSGTRPDSDATDPDDGSSVNDVDSNTADTRPHTKGCRSLKSLSVNNLICDSSNNSKNVNWGQNSFGKFAIPDDAQSTNLPITEKRLREIYGENVENGLTYGFNKFHELTDADVAFVEVGQDVTIHVTPIHDRQNYDTATAILTTLLNFEGVKAKYENYDASRSQIKRTERGTSARFPINEDIEQYDITIPAEEFDGPGRYSIGVTLSGIGEPNTGEFAEEFVVFYGGCRPPTLQCASRGKVEERNKVEAKIDSLTLVDTYLYPSSGLQSWTPPENIIASPGETLDFTLSTNIDNLAHMAVFVPMLDDVPQREVINVFLPREPSDLEDGKFVVGGRSEFKISAPEEPGTYRLDLAQHVNPVVSKNEAEGIGISSLSFGLGSNSLTIEVR